MPVVVQEEAIIGEIKRLLKFPNATICRHNVAAHLLSILELAGYPLSQELAGAVVRAEDEIALELLERDHGIIV